MCACKSAQNGGGHTVNRLVVFNWWGRCVGGGGCEGWEGVWGVRGGEVCRVGRWDYS